MNDNALSDLLRRLEVNKSEQAARDRILNDLRSLNAESNSPDQPASIVAEHLLTGVRPGLAPALADALERNRAETSTADLLRRLDATNPVEPQGPLFDVEDDTEGDDADWEPSNAGDTDEHSWRNRFSGPIPNFERQVELAKHIEAGVFAQAALDGEFAVADRIPREHLRVIAAHGKKAFEEFFTGNLRLVVHWAFRSAPYLEVQDKFQYGVFGLSRAIERWDWKRGYTFSTYASPHIRQAIARGVDNDAYTIRIPVHVQDKMRHGRAESVDDREESLLLRRARSITAGIYSLESLTADLAEEADPFDFGCLDPASWVDERVLNEGLVGKALSNLGDRESRIITQRVGFHDRQATLEDIGKSENVTRERIRQIESDVEHRLRSTLWMDYESLEPDRAAFKVARSLDPDAVRALMSVPTARRLARLAKTSGIDVDTLSSTLNRIKEAAQK